MEFLTRLAEEKIRQAIADGELDNLPGHGKPVVLEDFSEVPEHMRMAFKVLKNAGVLPLEIELHKELAALRQQLEESQEEVEQKRLRTEINDKSLKYHLLMEKYHRRSKQQDL